MTDFGTNLDKITHDPVGFMQDVECFIQDMEYFIQDMECFMRALG